MGDPDEAMQPSTTVVESMRLLESATTRSSGIHRLVGCPDGAAL